MIWNFMPGRGRPSVFNYDRTFSGDAPALAVPWISATFNDTSAAPGWAVRMTLSAFNLVPGIESISEMFFNLDPSLNPEGLAFNAVDVAASNLFNGKAGNGVFVGTDKFKRMAMGTTICI